MSKQNMIELTVERCTPTENDSFSLKLVNKSSQEVKTPFGTVTADRQVTFYMFVDEAVEVGFKSELDLNHFVIVENPFAYIDEKTGEEKIAQLKQLVLPSKIHNFEVVKGNKKVNKAMPTKITNPGSEAKAKKKKKAKATK